MNKSRLRMCTEDVQSAMSTAFKRNFDRVQFANAHKFTHVDKDVAPVFTLQSKFQGKGEYVFEGQAKIYDESMSSKRYSLSGIVRINDNDGEPIVEFVGSISVRLL